MSIYEEFRNFLQKEFGVGWKNPNLEQYGAKKPKKLWTNPKLEQFEKPKVPKIAKHDLLSEHKHSGSSVINIVPRAFPRKESSVTKGGQGSGRKAGSGSKLAAPKRGSPIKTAISRYYGKRTPSLHQKVVEAFRGKESKKTKIEDPLKGLKHPWD